MGWICGLPLCGAGGNVATFNRYEFLFLIIVKKKLEENSMLKGSLLFCPWPFFGGGGFFFEGVCF